MFLSKNACNSVVWQPDKHYVENPHTIPFSTQQKTPFSLEKRGFRMPWVIFFPLGTEDEKRRWGQ
jgi:hypothetical protein